VLLSLLSQARFAFGAQGYSAMVVRASLRGVRSSADGSPAGRSSRAWLTAAVLLVALGLLLTRCPANRDGPAGQLHQAMQDGAAGARSSALALDLYERRRSTKQLTSVQISDARDDALKSYKTVAELRPTDSTDLARQKHLLDGINTLVVELDSASAVVRGIDNDASLPAARDGLLAAAESLEKGYR
jgi:hypothetical protein